MDRIVNRIKLKKLFSEPEFFDPIIFTDGPNIILGEKSDENTTKGRKTTGVGKSLSVEFINFCLFKKYSESRVKLIPNNTFDQHIYINLDLEIGNDKLTIKRNRKEQDQPIIVRNGKEIKFESIDDAQQYITDLIYSHTHLENLPSFRELISPLIRDERSEFKNILECFDVNRKIPINYIPHLFFLNISLDLYKKTQDIVNKIEEQKTISKNAKKDITDNNQKKIKDVKAELNALNDEIEKMTEAIENFKSNDAFNSIQNDLVQIEYLLEKLRVRQKAIKYELKKIQSLPKPEIIERDQIETIFNKFKQGLGDLIVKSLDETIEFKEKIESFQRSLINQKATELEKQLENITSDIKRLDNDYSEKLKALEQKGVLKNLKTGIKVLNQKNLEYSRRIGKYTEYDNAEKEKKTLHLQKTQAVHDLDKAIESNDLILNSFLDTILDIHDFIMGNKECSFDIDTINNKSSKKTVSIDLRIYDDGSHSVDRTKVFVYDIALLFNRYTKMRHPGLLIHDNIFDVDQDTLIQSLNFLDLQEKEHNDFQYILTLNRDKIEHEEKLDQLKLEIRKHRVASFTKEAKFLRLNYQEIN